MSSAYVRTAVKTAWPVLVPTIPFVETINTVPSSVEIDVPIWAALIFETSASNHITMGSRPLIEEYGTITVALMSYSGEGDDSIAAAADVIVRAFQMWITSDRSLWIQSVDGPRPPDAEAIGDHYRLIVNLNYVHQTQGG